MGMGINARLGLAKEATWGTAVAATDYLAIVRATLNRRHEYVSRSELLGNWSSPNRELATIYGDGDVEFLVKTNVWGHVLRSMFGPPVTTVIASPATQHDFLQTSSKFSSDVHFWPYTLELFRDVTGTSRQFTGAVVNALRINAAAGPGDPYVRGTASFITKDILSLASTTQSFETYGPYHSWEATITLDGAGINILEQFEVTVNNNAERFYRLNATQVPAGFERAGYQDVEISGRISFEDETQYDRFRQNSIGQFEVTFTQSAATVIQSIYQPQMLITMPQLHYTAFAVDISGPTRLVAAFTGHARYSVGSTTAVRFRLLNERVAGY